MKKLIIILISLISIVSASAAYGSEAADTLQLEYKLHGQTRRFRCVFSPDSDGGITLQWGIERNLKWWSGTYHMPSKAVSAGSSMSFLMPEDGNHITLDEVSTFAMISRKALSELKSKGRFCYDNMVYELVDSKDSCELGALIHVKDPAEGCEMWILDDEKLPLVWQMSNNPLEINWRTRKLN